MFIEKIEIQFFRSIYRETITGIHDLNVFTGKNDVGKSNILKALNLFFNNETDSGVPFSFLDNFNFQRLRECQDSIKGKQFIQIKITFIRGRHSEKTLPSKFTVTKKWFRTDTVPSFIDDDLGKRLTEEGRQYSDRSKSSLTAFLNKVRYIYIPAIKDAHTFQKILSLLRETIYNDRLSQDKQLGNSMSVLSERIAKAAQELNEEFESATGVRANLSSPKSISELYQAIGVDTEVDNNGNTISLDGRGDGIRVRYLPSILHYIAKNSSNMYIWGFEEPENSLEYNLAMKMATDFERTYCHHSQILTTSHSPAFIGLPDNDHNSLYRCYRENTGTKIITLSQAQHRDDLAEELGYVQIQNEIFETFKKKTSALEATIQQKDKLLEELHRLKRPVLYTEGKTDAIILNTAWKKIYGEQKCPFDIKSCSTLDEKESSAGGCEVLKTLLNSARFDSPQIVIGLFDRDQAGIKAFSLNKNYTEMSNDCKQHKNGRAYALLLPVPPGKEKFAEYKNLCIEFYFEKSDLELKVDGEGLVLISPPATMTYRGISIKTESLKEMHFQEIDGNTKIIFAEKVVPILPETSFVHFKQLFYELLHIISLDNQPNNL